jgi:multiple sugar transport system substrate-binding protein
MGIWGGKTYTIDTDGDHFAVYYRKSWFEDPKEKAAFKKKYKYELAPPKTWDEFRQIAEFFTRDTSGKGQNDRWGTAFMASRGELCFEFVQRWYSFGGEFFFDPKTMEPQINNEAGLKALKDLHDIMPYCPPGVLTMTFTENRDAFVQGKLAMIMNWPDIGGQSEKPDISKVVGDVRYSLVPGAYVNGKFNQKALLPFGFCTMLSADSKHKEAAYQFMRYFSSKDVSTWVVSQSMGLDAWRKSHFVNPILLKAFPSAPEFYANILKSFNIGVFDLRIPGAQKYYDIIGIRVGEALASRGEINYQAVLNEIAKEWNEYTNQLGREKQLKVYRSSIGYTD